MRALILLVTVLFGCTKPNPNRCCTDEADCEAKDIPVGSMCEQGLVCRGNQCISQPCTSSDQCDAAAPYCIAELCAEECAEDAQCPGAGETADEMFCVAGNCVTCRSGSDCSTTAPVCDAGACRGCTSHDECGSQVCDSGQCIAEAAIAYASPTGSTTSSCTVAQPCSLERSLAVVDATRNTIKLLPGTYAAPTTASGYWYFRGGHELSIHGPATLHGALALEAPNAGTAYLRLRDLSTTSWLQCSAVNAVNLPTLTLERVSMVYSNNPDQGSNIAVTADRCKLNIRNSTIRSTDPYAGAVRLGGGGGTLGQLATIDRTMLQVAEGLTFQTVPAITIAEYASLKMTNSVVRGGSALTGSISLGTNVSPSTVAFSTFYNGVLMCPGSTPVLASSNNIFLNENANAPPNTVTGNACTHDYVIAKPQATALSGANNKLNMDPRFVNGADGDFHVMAGSPAIDAADPAATEAVDFDGTTRPQGAGRDIGAFEFK